MKYGRLLLSLTLSKFSPSKTDPYQNVKVRSFGIISKRIVRDIQPIVQTLQRPLYFYAPGHKYLEAG